MRIPKRVLLPAVLIIAISLIAIHINATIERITLLSGKIGQLESRIEVLEGKVRILEHPLIPAIGFTFLSRLEDMDALQSVCSDGTYFYNVGPGNDPLTKRPFAWTLYKRNMDGSLIQKLENANDYGTHVLQINGVFEKDGLLYVGGFANYSGPPFYGYIKVFRASCLSYLEEHAVKNYSCEGAVWHNNKWWVFYTDWGYISTYSEKWNFLADYQLTDQYPLIAPNGMIWLDDYMYLNNHEDQRNVGNPRQTLDCYYWTGSGFEFITSLDRPTPECTQGIYKEPNEDIIWWAEKNGGGQGIHNIVKSTIEHS